MSGLFIFTIISLTSLLAGALMFKLSSQHSKDAARQVYELTFPSDLPVKAVENYFRHIAGARPRSNNIRGVFSNVYEVMAEPGSVRFVIRLPHVQATTTISQLQLIPGVAVRRIKTPEPVDYDYVVELGLTNPTRPLDVPTPEKTAEAILKRMDSLQGDERLVIQTVLTPAPKMKQPSASAPSDSSSVVGVLLGRSTAHSEEVKERKAKLGTPNFYGVIRVAAKAKNKQAAKRLVDGVRDVYAATSSHSTYWTVRPLTHKMALRGITEARGPVIGAPIQLSSPEATALIAWPIDGPQVAGLPAGRAKYLPVPPSVPTNGYVLGDGNFPGGERQVSVSAVNSCRHFHIIGRTGSGKSTLAESLAAQAINSGRGLVYVDPKRDSFETLANLIPRHRLNDVELFDVNDTSRPVGFNLLGQGSPEQVASDMQAMFNHIYKNDAGLVRMPEVLYHVVMTLLSTTGGKGGYTMLDIMPLLWPSNREETLFSKAIIAGVSDPYIKAWWKPVMRMSANEREKYFQSLRSRIWQLNSRSDVRYIIGQSENTLDMRRIVQERKILLVNLKGLPAETSSLIGSSIVNNLWHAIREGGASEEQPFHLFLDEFHNFTNTPIHPETMLAEGRSAGLSLGLIHQGLDQLEGRRALLDAVMNNAINKVVFQRGLKDARTFASEFSTPVTDEDMKRLGQYEFMARLQTDTGVCAPFTGITRPPLKPVGLGAEVQRLSRERYGKSVHDVEAEIQARRVVPDRRQESPAVGDEEWET